MRPGPWAAWAKWARRPSGLGSGVGLGWPVGQGQKVAEPVEEGRGTRRSGRKGGPGRLGQTSQKGGSILVRFQVGFGPMRFRKISN
jgi:hypothetical protein